MKSVLLALLAPVLAVAEVVPGTWCSQYLDAREYADAQKLPLVYIWSSYEKDGEKCHYCESLETALDTAAVKKWMAEKGFVFCETWAEAGKDVGERNEGAFTFASTAAGTAKKITKWPIVCLYWPTGKGFTAVNFIGRSGTMPSTGGGLAQQFMDSVDEFFADYGKDFSGRFACGDTAFDRLEAEAATAFVDVPLKRTDSASAFETVDRLVSVWPNGKTLTNEVDWAAGEDARFVRVKMSGAFIVGGVVSNLLYNAKDELVDESVIAMVADQENSPANPLWIGERTAATLAAGEWTMDLDAALARSRSKKSPTLVIVGGSRWCPDCVNTDEYFIDTPTFRNWASENDVSCVAVDVPMIDSATPCLLNYESFDCWWLSGVTSGAGYLSRHGVPYTGNGGTNATAVAARNAQLLYNDVEHGGLCRPECMDVTNPETSKFKTGIPCLILMDAGGRILGRIYQFNNVSPTDTSAAGAYVQRLNELIALGSDATEEVNRHWTTAGASECGLPVVLNETRSVNSDASAVDTSDCWQLTGIASSLRCAFSVKAAKETGTAGQTNAALSLWKKTASGAERVARKTGNLFAGIAISDASVGTDAEWFLQVETLAESDAFSLERPTDSRVGYALSASAAGDPGTAAFVTVAQTVDEADVKKAGGVTEVRVIARRSGGATGVLTVPVEIDGSSTAESDRYALLDTSVTWADGDTADKVVRIAVYDDVNADGTQDAIFLLGESVFTLTIVDDDKATPGKLSIAECEPAIAKSKTVIATEGETVRIGVARIGGASGPAAGTLSSTAGQFEDATAFVWANREAGVQWCELRLPTLAEAPKSGKVTVTLTAAAGSSVDSSTKKVDISLVAVDAPRFAEERVSLAAERYVALERTVDLLNVSGLSGVAAKKLSGTIPSGVKVAVDGVRLRISGSPTAKAGVYSAVYQLSGKIGKTTVAGRTMTLGFTVTDFTSLPSEDPGANPAAAAGMTVAGMTMIDAASRCIVGQIENLAINSRGKLSAKYACAEGKIALKCDAWSSYDSASGKLTAELTAAKSAHALTVEVARDGSVSAMLYDPAWPEGDVSSVVATDWQALPGGAGDWQGAYTVDFYSPSLIDGSVTLAPAGDPIATLSMTKASDVAKGVVKYAAVLPNGRGVSGSATLVKVDPVSAVLPIYSLSSGDTFFASPLILSGRPKQAIGDWERVVPRWRHVESKTDAGDYELSYLTAGSAYDPSADLGEIALANQGTDLRLFVTEGYLEQKTAVVGESKITVADAKADSLKLTLTKSSGLISGSFKFTGPDGKKVSASFKGVVLPDWDGCPSCGERPFAAGSFWYSDKLLYTLNGKQKSVSIKRGDAVMIEVDLTKQE